jgi:hypothetical protein
MAAMRVSILLLSAKTKNHAGRHGKKTRYMCARAFRLKLRFGVRNLLLFLTARKRSHGSGGLIVSALPAKSSIFTNSIFLSILPYHSCKNDLIIFIK